MSKSSVVALFFLFIFAGSAFGENNVIDNVTNEKLSIYKEQQMQYIDMALELEKDNARLFREHNRLGMSGSASRAKKMDDNKDKLNGIKMKMNDLKIRVIDAAGKIPDWWNENEEHMKRRIKYYFSDI